MADNSFFDDATQQSIIKMTIVEKYFDTWAAIITNTQSRHRPAEGIRYVDLFSGPGRYQNGEPSTPIRVLEKAISKAAYRGKLHTVFNDMDPDNVKLLNANLVALPGYDTLVYKPVLWNKTIDDSIINDLSRLPPMPTLAFIDPWGYKGLSLELIATMVKGWGCDCIFFFNFRRVNSALNNEVFDSHMAALFGARRAAKLDQQLRGHNPHQRELAVINELSVALGEQGCQYVLPFCFKDRTGIRTSHHLVLATKHFKGYDRMKEIMAKYSSEAPEGVPSFMYSPAVNPDQQVLLGLNRPLDDLRGMLLKHFSGRTLSAGDLYREHSVGLRYIYKNYREVLRSLMSDKLINVSHVPKTGFPPEIIITFLKQQEQRHGG